MGDGPVRASLPGRRCLEVADQSPAVEIPVLGILVLEILAHHLRARVDFVVPQGLEQVPSRSTECMQ